MITSKWKYTDQLVLFSYTFIGYLALSVFFFQPKGSDLLSFIVVLAILSLLFLFRWSKFKSSVYTLASWKSRPQERLKRELKWATTNAVLFSVPVVLLYLVLNPLHENYVVLVVVVLLYFAWAQFVNLGAEMLHLLVNIKKTQRRVNQEKSEVIKIKQEVLQDLVSPHFLFNSLNTISTFISENSDESIRIVKELSDLYGFMLTNSHKTVVLLEEDLALAKKYAYLLEKRFENAIKINFAVPNSCNYCLIPPMTLQNLVENCVKHNVITKKAPLKIEIFTEDDYLVVRNNLNLKMNSGKGSTSIGLNYIETQVDQMIDKKVIIDQSESHFIVKIPLIYHVNIKIDESIDN